MLWSAGNEALASRLLANAICEPSGEKAGSVSDAGLLVRLIWPVPWASIAKISLLPLPRRNAIREPSGEMAGSRSAAGLVVRFV